MITKKNTKKKLYSKRKNKTIKKKHSKKKLKYNNKIGGGLAIMPKLCFGTVQSSLAKNLQIALDIGYRHIDSADSYNNSSIIREGLKSAKIPRDDIWITWKGMPQTIDDIRKTVDSVGCKYFDLYLIHFWKKNYTQINILIEAQKQGLIRFYGVSNCYDKADIDNLTTGEYKIYANQIQARPPGGHILNRKDIDDDFIEYCNTHGVKVMLYASISGFLEQMTSFGEEEFEFIRTINPYYLQKYIYGDNNPNVLIVGSVSGRNLSTNYRLYEKGIKGEGLLDPSEIVKIETQLQGVTLALM